MFFKNKHNFYTNLCRIITKALSHCLGLLVRPSKISLPPSTANHLLISGWGGTQVSGGGGRGSECIQVLRLLRKTLMTEKWGGRREPSNYSTKVCIKIMFVFKNIYLLYETENNY